MLNTTPLLKTSDLLTCIELTSRSFSQLRDHLKPRDDRVPIVVDPAINRESLLTKYSIGKIELRSIDTEGTEIDALESMDLGLHASEIIVVEFNTAARELAENELRECFGMLP